MAVARVVILATVLGYVMCTSRGFIPSSGGCAPEILQHGCECHTISDLVITCKNLDLEHWPRFADMGAVGVELLDISGNAFDYIPSNAFGNLRIKHLVMSNNRNVFRTSNVGDVFNEHQASTLLSLDLSETGLRSFPAFIDGLTSLRSLNLVGNDIDSVPGSIMASSPDFAELRLGHVTRLDANAFDSMPNLRVLEIRPQSTSLIRIPEFLGQFNTLHLEDLESLIIRNSPKVVMDEELHIILNLAHLELVNSSMDAFQLVMMNVPNDYRTMRVINMSHNQIIFIPETFMACFQGLESIDFSHNPLRVVGPSSFSANPHLRYVDLSHCSLSYVSSGGFSGLVDLEVLDLSDNFLWTLASDVLPQNWAGLVVYLGRNELVCHCGIQWLVNVTVVQHVGGPGPLDPYEVDHELRCDDEPRRPLLYTVSQTVADSCQTLL